MNHETWEAVQRRNGVSVDEDLFAALVDARLIVTDRHSGRWSFVHALCRAAVLAHTRLSGRLERWAGTAAETLRATRGPKEPFARLLIDAGRSDEAIAPLARAALRDARDGDLRLANHLVALRSALCSSRPGAPRSAQALDSTLLRLFLLPPSSASTSCDAVGLSS